MIRLYMVFMAFAFPLQAFWVGFGMSYGHLFFPFSVAHRKEFRSMWVIGGPGGNTARNYGRASLCPSLCVREQVNVPLYLYLVQDYRERGSITE